MNTHKKKILKSGAFLVATALVLLVATVAWFLSGGESATVSGILAEVETSGVSYLLLEAEDTNKNGILDPDEAEEEKWVPVPDLNIEVSNLVPNQYRFFKAVIMPGARTTLQFGFNDIAVTIEDSTTTEEEFLSLIHVRFRTEDDAEPVQPMTGGAAIDQSMYALLGDPAADSVLIYDLDLTAYTGDAFTIYYDVGVYFDAVPNEKMIGSSVGIGAIEFSTN